jgi:hypothetical protein
VSLFFADVAIHPNTACHRLAAESFAEDILESRSL